MTTQRGRQGEYRRAIPKPQRNQSPIQKRTVWRPTSFWPSADPLSFLRLVSSAAASSFLWTDV